jgi:hypothetical protein
MHKSQVPKGKKVLGGRLVLRTKRDRDGKILRHKARWVVKGYEQRYGKDYEQTFAGVCKSATWKIAVACWRQSRTIRERHFWCYSSQFPTDNPTLLASF